MAPWKLPLIVAGIALPIVLGFYVGGGGVGLATGALMAVSIVVFAAVQKPRGPIGSASAEDGGRHVLIVVADAVEEPGDVARIVSAGELGGADSGAEVRVLVPARIGFLDRWASDVEGSRRRAQEKLVATVAALAKAGVAAEARVGDEDVVQAVEDQLQSYPATEVVLVSNGNGHSESDGTEAAVSELRARLRAEFHHVQLAG
ncbi:MAG TPA: hypothetical protein VF245_06830 [Solirubrobacterales bacterium]